MKNQIIGFTIGILLVIVGISELIPALIDFIDNDPNFRAFLECSLASVFFGGALMLANSSFERTLYLRQTFLLTTLSWFALCFFASLPLYFSTLHLSFTDAFFEAISGITTTGSTVLSGLDDMSRGILLWRSITQWIGGIGIIAFAIIILPFLRIGGMQLFQTESSDRSEKIMPKTLDLVAALMKVYVLLTVACFLTYASLGMSAFDAINHALTTIPTGGYSTHDTSFGYFESASLHYAAAFFMLAGAIPFVLYAKALFQGQPEFHKDEQIRSLLGMLAVFVAVLTAWLWTHSELGLLKSLQYAVFNIISVITTTGYATTDYTLWGGFSVTFLLFITFLGACAGSTSGGIKVMRLIIATKVIGLRIKQLIYPNGVFALTYQGRTLDHSVGITVLAFIGLYVASNIVLTISLAMMGLDFQTAFSGAVTAMANVGPGIGEVIGPAGNFASLPEAAKWLLSAGMLLGRLEIMTVLVLFRYDYWQL